MYYIIAIFSYFIDIFRPCMLKGNVFSHVYLFVSLITIKRMDQENAPFAGTQAFIISMSSFKTEVTVAILRAR